MRSIGKKNIRIVKETTLKALKRHTDFTGSTEYSTIEDEVVDELPTEMWDTWEGSDSEIRNIIDEICTNWSHGEKSL